MKYCEEEINYLVHNKTMTILDTIVAMLFNGHIHFTALDMVQWRHHGMQMLCALVTLCAGNPPVTGKFPQRVRHAGLWCCPRCQPKQTVEQKSGLPEIQEAMTLMCATVMIANMHRLQARIEANDDVLFIRMHEMVYFGNSIRMFKLSSAQLSSSRWRA